APLRPLLQPHEHDVSTAMRNLSAALQGFDSGVTLHIQLLDGKSTDDWTVTGGGTTDDARRVVPESAEIRVVLRRETWLRIARSELSPLEAFFGGRVRVGGDMEVAKRVLKHLTDSAVPFLFRC